MERFDLVIVGAGVAGASLARLAASRGKRVLVLEALAAPGGCLQSHRLPDGFWFELGAHTCYNSYSTLLDLAGPPASLPLLPRQKAPWRLLVEGRVASIFGQLSVLEALGSAWRLFTSSKEGKTVQEYYSGLVGPKNYDRVFGPLFAAVPSLRADEFPASMLFKKRPRRKDAPRSFTVEGGLQTLVERLLDHPAVTLRTEVEVSRVCPDGVGIAVQTTAGEELTAPGAALAVPPSVAARLSAADFPEVQRPLAAIRTVQVEALGIVVRKDAVKLPLAAGFIPVDGSFYSVVTRDPVDHPTLRAFTVHFKPETPVAQRLGQAIELLGLPGPEAVLAKVEHQVLLPSPTRDHARRVQELDQALAGLPLLVTGNYFGGLAIEDCVRRSQVEVERLPR